LTLATFKFFFDECLLGFILYSQISRREPDFKPENLLDFGSGSGSATWYD